MDYREIIVDNTEYLHLSCTGSRDIESSKRVWQHIAIRLAQLDHGKVLLDEREVDLKTSISTDFQHASFVAELLRGICNRVAIIDVAENDKSNQFFETVCVNRSLNLRFFLHADHAIEWLVR